MKNNKRSNNKLIIYIVVSLVIHLTLFYFFPLNNKAGVASEKDTNDFGFIQVVEYEPSVTTGTDQNKNQSEEENIKKEELEDEKEEEIND